MRSVMSVSFPEQLSHELECFAKKTGRSKSDIIKESVALYLWEIRFNSLKKSMKHRKEKDGLITEEDVFNALNNDPLQPAQCEKMKNALKSSFGAWKDEHHPERQDGVNRHVRNQRKSTRSGRAA